MPWGSQRRWRFLKSSSLPWPCGPGNLAFGNGSGRSCRDLAAQVEFVAGLPLSAATGGSILQLQLVARRMVVPRLASTSAGGIAPVRRWKAFAGKGTK